MRFFATIGGLLVLVLTAALVIPYFVNWSDYRAQFESEASRLIGVPVHVDGDANLRLLPFPSLEFTSIRVGDKDAPRAQAKRIRLDAELAPFLTGEFHIFDLQIEAPRLALDIDDRGHPFWERERSTQSSALSFVTNIELERAHITEGSITLRQQTADGSKQWAITGIEGTFGVDSNIGPARFDGALVVDGVPANLSVSSGLFNADGIALNTRSVWPNRGLEIATQGRIEEQAETGALGYTGIFQVSPSDEPEIGFFAEGVFEADTQTVTLERYRATFGSGETPYTVEGDFSLDARGEALGYALTARGVQVNLDAVSTDGEPTDLARLGVDLLRRLPLPSTPGDITINLPAIIRGDTVIRDVRLVAQPGPIRSDGTQAWNLADITAVLPGRTTLEARGTLSTTDPGSKTPKLRFEGPIVLASRQPSGFAQWLGLANTPAIRNLPGTGFEAKLQIASDTARFDDLQILVGSDQLEGHAEFAFGNRPKPFVGFTLSGTGQLSDAANAFLSMVETHKTTTNMADIDAEFILNQPILGDLEPRSIEISARLREESVTLDRLLIEDLFGTDISAVGTLADDTSFDVSLVSIDAAPFLSRIQPTAETLKIAPLAAFGRKLQPVIARASSIDPASFSDTELTLRGRLDEKKLDVLITGKSGGTAITADLVTSENALRALSATAVNPDGRRLAAQATLDIAQLPEPTDSGEIAIQLSQRTTNGKDTLDTIINAKFGETSFSTQGDWQAGEALTQRPWSYHGVLSAVTSDLSALLQKVRLPLGAFVKAETDGALTASVSVHGDGSATLNKAELTSGANQFGADLVISDLGADVSVTGTLSGDTVSADGLLFPIAGLTPLADATTVFSKSSNQIPDLDLNIELARIELFDKQVTLDDVVGSIQFEAGEMRLTDLTGQYDDAAITIPSATLRNTSGEMSISGQLSATNLPLHTVIPGLKARIDLSSGFAGSGRSATSLMAGLSGSGTISSNALTVTGVNSMAFPDFIASADAIGFGIDESDIAELVSIWLLTDQTTFAPLVSSYVLVDGQMRLSNVTMKSTDGMLTAISDVNLNLVDWTGSGTTTLRYDPGDFTQPGLDAAIRLGFGARAKDTGMAAVSAFVMQRSIEREQQRIAALQARLLERQRLRRATLRARFVRDQRIAAETEAARIAQEAEQARLQAERERREKEEQERLEKQRLEQEQAERLRLEEERRRQERQPSQTVPSDPFRAEVERETLTAPTPQQSEPPAQIIPNLLFDDLDFSN